MKEKPTKKKQPITLDKLARMVDRGFEAAKADRGRLKAGLDLDVTDLRRQLLEEFTDLRKELRLDIADMNRKLDRIERTLPTKLQRRVKAIEEALNL